MLQVFIDLVPNGRRAQRRSTGETPGGAWDRRRNCLEITRIALPYNEAANKANDSDARYVEPRSRGWMRQRVCTPTPLC